MPNIPKKRYRLEIAVVLETMWGDAGKAPGWFCISSRNFSGRRLYYLTGVEHDCLWVTNACREQVSSPNEHGRPDPDWLLSNLNRVDPKVLLVCGRVAQSTILDSNYTPSPSCAVLFIPHPAARNWTRQQLDETRSTIQEILDASHSR